MLESSDFLASSDFFTSVFSGSFILTSLALGLLLLVVVVAVAALRAAPPGGTALAYTHTESELGSTDTKIRN